MSYTRVGDYCIYDWLDVSEQFGDTILLGNGSSIAISSIYHYDTILSRSRELGYVGDEEERIFLKYNTSNFERVLEGLQHTEKVIDAVRPGDRDLKKQVRQRTSKIKKALKQTVFDMHERRSAVSEHFPHIAEFLGNFRRVFSLNYDLIVYWSLLAGTNLPTHQVSMTDCFFKDEDRAIDGNLNLFFQADAARSRLSRGKTYVFYPHGNFTLAKERTDEGIGREVKIRRYNDKMTLLRTITRYWMSGKYEPLIVSEGNKHQKEYIISQSQYLRTVLYDILPQSNESVVFYGFGFGESDTHILENAFARGQNINRVGVSVYVEGMSNNQIAAYCRDAEGMIRGAYRNGGGSSNLDIVFFNSGSDGAWIHREASEQQADAF